MRALTVTSAVLLERAVFGIKGGETLKFRAALA